MRRFLAWLFAEHGALACPNTSAYCQARARLNLDELSRISFGITDKIENAAKGWLWLGRVVKVVAGSGLSMPDTEANQRAWPQSKKAKPGCSFPVMRIVALFSLATGAMIDIAHRALDVHERTLLRSLWEWLGKGDVLLADRGFGSYAEFVLLPQAGVDCVMRKNARRKNAGVVRRINKRDRIVLWKKSGLCPKWLDTEIWESMPQTIAVREIEVHVPNPGFRTKVVMLVTTLLDHRLYPERELVKLYRRRWDVELFLRDIKTTMGMDVLRCKTPRMVEKELWMYVIAYNLIRALMTEAALAHGSRVSEISFKGTLSTVRQWAPILSKLGLLPRQRLDLYDALLYYLIKDKLLKRPDRTEPRARKRRPKNYQLLNKPRGEFREIPHRNKYKKA